MNKYSIKFLLLAFRRRVFCCERFIKAAKKVLIGGSMQNELLIKKLNSSFGAVRKFAVARAGKTLLSGDKFASPVGEVNLNLHSFYSFSPYSPSLAAYSAATRGIKIAGLCDYGSIGGIKEFEKACGKFGISCLCGVELRARAGEKIIGVSLYGSNKKLEEIKTFLSGFRAGRIKKAQAVTAAFNRRLKKAGLSVDFEKDVLPVSAKKGVGTVMSKHIYLAASDKLIKKFGMGKPLADFIRDKMCLDLSEREYELLCDEKNPFYKYDLVQILRDNSRDYAVDNELPCIEKIAELAKNGGFVFAAEYHKAEPCEEFEKFALEAKNYGCNAVSFALKDCEEALLASYADVLIKNKMLALPFEKVEYPRNKFESSMPEFLRKCFLKCAYAALGNAKSVEESFKDGLFSDKTAEKLADFEERINVFSEIGKNS